MRRHVVVIGAGVIGLMSAYHLRQRGYQVTVVERSESDRFTTSYGNAGMIVPSHFVPLAAPGVVAQGIRWMANPKSPFYVKPRLDPELLSWGWRFWRAGTAAHVRKSAPLLLALNLASRDGYVELNDELGGGFEFERRGLMMLCNTQRGLEEEAEVAVKARELGVTANVLDAAEVRALEPDIDMNVVGGVHFTEDAHLDPAAFMNVLQRRLESDGVELRFGVEAEGLGGAGMGSRLTGVRLRSLESGAVDTLKADHVVLAAGSWSGKVAAQMGIKLPMQPGKGYSVTIEQPTQRLSIPSLLSEARVAVTRMGESLRVGGTMELTGFDDAANELRMQGIFDAAQRYFPRLTREELEAPPRWHGYRPCSPDGLPYLGNSARYANLTVATGHSMMGVSLAPITGELVGELVAGEEPSIAIDALRPERH